MYIFKANLFQNKDEYEDFFPKYLLCYNLYANSFSFLLTIPIGNSCSYILIMSWVWLRSHMQGCKSDSILSEVTVMDEYAHDVYYSHAKIKIFIYLKYLVTAFLSH